MTNFEAVKAELQNIVATDDAVLKALEDNNIDGTNTYEYTKAQIIAKCTVQVLLNIMSSMNISEGGLSVSNNPALLEKRINFLTQKYELDDIVSGRQVIPISW